MNGKGAFITFEGIDGSGKTTQLELLYKELLSRKVDVIKTREPGGTIPGERIRNLLSDKQFNMEPVTELLLFFSSRVQLIEELIKPALKTGKTVLCDRFHDATVAYQSYGRGLSMDMVTTLEKAFVLPVKPDRTFLLDCPYEVAKNRMSARNYKTRIETMDRAFFDRVRQGYLNIAKSEPDRIVVVDATGTIEDVHRYIKDDFFSWAPPHLSPLPLGEREE